MERLSAPVAAETFVTAGDLVTAEILTTKGSKPFLDCFSIEVSLLATAFRTYGEFAADDC